MPQTVSEDKCVKRAEAARGQVSSTKLGRGVLKTPEYNGVSAATPYNRRKGK